MATQLQPLNPRFWEEEGETGREEMPFILPY